MIIQYLNHSEAADHGEEEGGSLTIKPPPLMALKPHKDRSSHKHKRDKHRDRNYVGQISNISGNIKDRGRPEREFGHLLFEFLKILL